uniref:Uncharacterized protein n=1 Tax=Anguilla anguilla TaxID=7936 RepID=A0A0E9W634_ANGAN
MRAKSPANISSPHSAQQMTKFMFPVTCLLRIIFRQSDTFLLYQFYNVGKSW